jgi:hypothetical protein
MMSATFLSRRVSFVHETSLMGNGEPPLRYGKLIEEPPMFLVYAPDYGARLGARPPIRPGPDCTQKVKLTRYPAVTSRRHARAPSAR